MTPKKPGGQAAVGDPQMSLLPVTSSPLVAFRIQFRVGVIEEPEEREGLNALTALTIAAGGTAELTYRQVLDRLYPMAASIDVHPDREVTTFTGQVHRDHLNEFYRLLKGLLLTPRFDAADFQRNRDLLVAAIETNLRGNDEEELGKEALNVFLFPGHPYGRPVAGTARGLKRTTIEDVKEHYARHYHRGNLLIGLAGGYPDRFLETVREDFRRMPDGTTPRGPLPPSQAIHGLELLVVEKTTPTVAISIGAPLKVTRADRDFYALLVANSFFGEHRTFNGRLVNAMRAARGLNYGDYSYIESFVQDGGSTFPLANTPRRQQVFSIWIRPVARENALFALRQAIRELHRLTEEGMTQKEFEATRRFLLNYSRLWTQSLRRRLGYQMDAQFYGIPSYIDRIQEELPRLRVEDVNAAVRRHIDPANLKVALVAEGARGLLHDLLSGEPTPIHYQTPTTDPVLLEEDKVIAVFPLPINKEKVRIEPASGMFED